MEKWEYLFIIGEKYGKGVFGHVLPKEASWKIHYINGESQANWADVTLYNYLNKIGDQGWEVVSSVPQTIIRSGAFPVEHLYVTAKRPKT